MACASERKQMVYTGCTISHCQSSCVFSRFKKLSESQKTKQKHLQPDETEENNEEYADIEVTGEKHVNTTNLAENNGPQMVVNELYQSY